MVSMPDYKFNNETNYKSVEQNNNSKVAIYEIKEKYDLVVKEIIAKFIKAMPINELNAENITTISNSILNITNNIKEELFK